MKQTLSQSGLRWLWVTVIVILLDRVAKYCVITWLTPYTSVPVFSFFNVTLAYNKGAAFSFLADAGGWQAWMFGGLAVVVSITIFVWLSRLSQKQIWLSLALAMILGGALGNLSDRLLYTHVIDFLDFHLGNLHWPVFNLADSAICIGAFMLFWDATFRRKK